MSKVIDITVEKARLFRSIALQCGVNRVEKAVKEALENALVILNDQINMDEDLISLK